MFCWREKSAPPPHTRSEPMLRVYYFTLYVCIYEVAYIKKKIMNLMSVFISKEKFKYELSKIICLVLKRIWTREKERGAEVYSMV